jgi:hypothetical protein
VASRFAAYVKRVARIGIALVALGLVLAAVQALFHPFDALLAKGNALFDDLDSKLSHEAFSGITVGSLALILALCIFPIFLSRIDEKAYARGLWRGLISASVFFLSNKLFALASSVGRARFLVALLAVVIVSVLVIEGVSLAVREEEERSFRTDVVASIASGLLFGVLIKLAGLGLDFAKSGLSKIIQ